MIAPDRIRRFVRILSISILLFVLMFLPAQSHRSDISFLQSAHYEQNDFSPEYQLDGTNEFCFTPMVLFYPGIYLQDVVLIEREFKHEYGLHRIVSVSRSINPYWMAWSIALLFAAGFNVYAFRSAVRRVHTALSSY